MDVVIDLGAHEDADVAQDGRDKAGAGTLLPVTMKVRPAPSVRRSARRVTMKPLLSIPPAASPEPLMSVSDHRRVWERPTG
jgi:hypothetical protein